MLTGVVDVVPPAVFTVATAENVSAPRTIPANASTISSDMRTTGPLAIPTSLFLDPIGGRMCTSRTADRVPVTGS